MNQPAREYVFPDNIQPKGSFYHHPEHGPLVRTTAFLKAYGGRTEGLIDWAGKVERQATLAAADVIQQRNRGTPNPNFVGAVEGILGQARAAVKVKEAAADIGTAIHKRILFDMSGGQGEPPALTEHSTAGYMAYKQWWAGSGITLVRAEQFVFCPRLKAAGSVDLFGLRDGRLGVIDYKSSAYVYEDHHLQLMAYVMMGKSLGLPVEWAEIVHLPKTLENAFRPIVPIPLGEFTWWNRKPQKVTRTWEQLERCVWAARVLYQNLMEER
jgi:hypothetical protein